MIHVKLNIRPMPSPRPRVYGKVATMPKKYKEHKQLIQAKLKGFKHLGDLPLRVEFLFVFKEAKGSKKNKYSMPLGDLDNLEKTYMDAMEGIIYENDRQVVEKKSKKMYGEVDAVFMRVEVMI